MCIRDRYSGETSHLPVFGSCHSGDWSAYRQRQNLPRRSSASVSYTHLDVYKRQGMDWIPHCKKTFNGAQTVMKYLGKYTPVSYTHL